MNPEEKVIHDLKINQRWRFEHFKAKEDITNFTVAVLEEGEVRVPRHMKELIDKPNVLVCTTPHEGQEPNFTIQKGTHARCIALVDVWPY